MKHIYCSHLEEGSHIEAEHCIRLCKGSILMLCSLCWPQVVHAITRCCMGRGYKYMNKIHGLVEFTQMINRLVPDYELEAEILDDGEGTEMLMVSCRRLEND